MNRQSTARKNYTTKRTAAALAFLGGKCVVCGASSKLEFDHIDPETKAKEISTAIQVECWSWDRLLVELRKCQLLCRKHHVEKTNRDLYHEQPCGTYWKYRKYRCRCDPCVQANKEQLAAWKKPRPT